MKMPHSNYNQSNKPNCYLHQCKSIVIDYFLLHNCRAQLFSDFGTKKQSFYELYYVQVSFFKYSDFIQAKLPSQWLEKSGKFESLGKSSQINMQVFQKLNKKRHLYLPSSYSMFTKQRQTCTKDQIISNPHSLCCLSTHLLISKGTFLNYHLK